MITQELTPERQAVVERYAADLVSGRAFRLRAAGPRSAIGYRPPTRGDAWGRVVEVLGTYAQVGDRQAATVQRVLQGLPLYQTDHELMGVVWEQLADVARDGWIDVIGRSGPNAGRPSAYQHDTDVPAAVALMLLGDEVEAALAGASATASVGWCLHRLALQHDVRPYRLRRVYRALYPTIAES